MALHHCLVLGCVALVGCGLQTGARSGTKSTSATATAPGAVAITSESTNPSPSKPQPGASAQQQLMRSIFRELELEAQLQETTDVPQRTALERQLEELRLERSSLYSPSS